MNKSSTYAHLFVQRQLLRVLRKDVYGMPLGADASKPSRCVRLPPLSVLSTAFGCKQSGTTGHRLCSGDGGLFAYKRGRDRDGYRRITHVFDQ